jgi:hypothetical protein
MIQMLISQSPDIQKVLAFEGAFEKLFNTVTHEGGLEGGVISQDALRCVDSLLRYNSSNQVINVLCLKRISIDLYYRVTSAKHLFQRCYAPSCSYRPIFPCEIQLHKSLHCSFGTHKKWQMCHWCLE